MTPQTVQVRTMLLSVHTGTVTFTPVPEVDEEDRFDPLDQPAVYHGVCPKTTSISAEALNKMAAAAGRREGETDAEWGPD